MSASIDTISIAMQSQSRSRRFLALSTFCLLLYLTISYVVYVNVPLPSGVFSIWEASIVIMIAGFFVYWYLQIKPSSLHFVGRDEHFGYAKPQHKLVKIAEIREAIELYDHHKQEGEKRYDLLPIIEYIEKRLNIFPPSHEFSPYNVGRLNLDSEVRRKLFFSSLKSLTTQLEAQVLEEKELSKNEPKKETKDSRFDTIQLGRSFTNRINTEIEQLSRRANLYITFGSLITVTAGVILFYVVNDITQLVSIRADTNNDAISSTDWFSLISRFSIVIFVEIFAFFYLRLYKEMMINIKYYQNEITNIEMKMLAIHTIDQQSLTNHDATNSIINSLANCERNFVIDKGKTTIDIERTKVENSFTNSVFNNIHKLTKSIKQP
ncbi:TPA: hypothetical protein ACF37V_000807 [Vibrio parahaemolyticus]|uniref:hypothetical protein n=1 Tax=Vibrio parahaemolyticus TaxID=670 RepID=UPI00084B6779|nr:hypothetical protein [Vibrio parahaemolyticus]ODZ32759.1 hypothetical protein BBM38_15680 [Vibrio parahaemolyticus]ODZ38479.1 hypothetical protein BBM37_08230 [Vibrio parahaemolyticus]OHX52097.1 hypothetical protein BBZ60_23210 [Vibrio parahaemolyticus]